MYYLGFLFALIIALLFTSIFFFGFRNRGPWGTFWSFFLIIFLVVWGAAVWFTDLGPVWMDIAWAPLLFIGLIMAAVLAAATPPERPERTIVEEPTTPPGASGGAITVFFWLTVIVLGGLIIFGLIA